MQLQPGRFTLPASVAMAVLAISTASLFVRFAQTEAPSLVIAALRLSLATAVLLPLVLARHRARLRQLARRELLLASAAGALLALHFAAWITSLEYTSVASSVVLVSTGPLWVALASPLLLKERPSSRVVGGMLMALIGGLVINIGDGYHVFASLAGPAGNRAVFGNGLALVGAWALAGYLIIGRRLRTGIPLVPYIFLVYGFAALALVAAVVVTGQRFSGYPAEAYLWIFLLALVPQLIGHSLFNWALRFFPASLVSIAVLGEPLGSALLAYLVLSEAPGWLTALGGAVVLAGLVISTRRKV